VTDRTPALIWEGAPVVRLIPLRMALNFWRVHEHTEAGFRVRFYRTRRGVTILSVEVVVA
jgi:hypothetical protein